MSCEDLSAISVNQIKLIIKKGINVPEGNSKLRVKFGHSKYDYKTPFEPVTGEDRTCEWNSSALIILKSTNPVTFKVKNQKNKTVATAKLTFLQISDWDDTPHHLTCYSTTPKEIDKNNTLNSSKYEQLPMKLIITVFGCVNPFTFKKPKNKNFFSTSFLGSKNSDDLSSNDNSSTFDVSTIRPFNRPTVKLQESVIEEQQQPISHTNSQSNCEILPKKPASQPVNKRGSLYYSPDDYNIDALVQDEHFASAKEINFETESAFSNSNLMSISQKGAQNDSLAKSEQGNADCQGCKDLDQRIAEKKERIKHLQTTNKVLETEFQSLLNKIIEIGNDMLEADQKKAAMLS